MCGGREEGRMETRFCREEAKERKAADGEWGRAS